MMISGGKMIVKEKVGELLKVSDTIQSFQRGCSKGTIVESIQKKPQDDQNKEPLVVIPKFEVSESVIAQVTENAHREIQRITEENKKQVMKAGSIFKELVKKGKHQNQGYIHMACHVDEKELRWERVPDATTFADNFTNSSIFSLSSFSLSFFFYFSLSLLLIPLLLLLLILILIPLPLPPPYLSSSPSPYPYPSSLSLSLYFSLSLSFLFSVLLLSLIFIVFFIFFIPIPYWPIFSFLD